MIEYHSVNVTQSDFQLDKLRSSKMNVTEVTLRLSSGMIGTAKTNFHYHLLLTN